MSIKRFIKKHKRLKDFCINQYYTYRRCFSYLFPKLSSKLAYKKALGKVLNIKNPTTLNEKMMYLKLFVYWNDSKVALCADKYKVRGYVTSKGYSHLLIDLIGHWEDADEINWSILPNKFAIKCNHGSGYNIICADKDKLDKQATQNKLNGWLKEKFGVVNVEQGIYGKIKPIIIAEKFIETSDGLPPKDYKFFCSYGDVKLLFVASERINDHTKFDYYYPDWTWIPVKNSHPNAGATEKPSNLDEMLKIASDLSMDFPLVRVDLYCESEKIYFGELTFTHFGCLHPFDPDEYDEIFGKLFPDVSKCDF
jgi:hypothetical protein